MTKHQIADCIIAQFQSDSGIVLGIPANCQNALHRLLEFAVEMARTEQKIEKER